MDKLQLTNDLYNTLENIDCNDCVIYENCKAALVSEETNKTICETLKYKLLYGVE